jgi:hypothetical protein
MPNSISKYCSDGSWDSQAPWITMTFRDVKNKFLFFIGIEINTSEMTALVYNAYRNDQVLIRGGTVPSLKMRALFAARGIGYIFENEKKMLTGCISCDNLNYNTKEGNDDKK